MDYPSPPFKKIRESPRMVCTPCCVFYGTYSSGDEPRSSCSSLPCRMSTHTDTSSPRPPPRPPPPSSASSVGQGTSGRRCICRMSMPCRASCASGTAVRARLLYLGRPVALSTRRRLRLPLLALFLPLAGRSGSEVRRVPACDLERGGGAAARAGQGAGR